MSLLRDIQQAAVDSSVDITIVLRKCKVLAARLGNEDFKNWVDRELNGYGEDIPIPEYRVFSVNSKGYFSGPFGSGLRNADMPISCLPEDLQESYRQHRAMAPISSYSSLLADSSKEAGIFKVPWPPELVAVVARKIYVNMNCLRAWQVIPRSCVATLIDSVRNRILDFALQIEAENPDAGEAPLNSNPIPQEKVTHVFNTYIAGDVQNVAAGSAHVQQSAELTVHSNDVNSLLCYLRSMSVEEEDLTKLEVAIQADATAEAEDGPFGVRVTAWMATMINKTTKGIWKIGTGVATSVLAKALMNFYGLK